MKSNRHGVSCVFNRLGATSGMLAVLAAMTLAGLVWTVPVLADEGSLPSGEKVMEDYIKATGGKEAREKIHSRKNTGFLEMVGMGLKMNMVTYSAEPNLNYQEISSDSFGKMRSGSNGEVAWEVSSMQGAAVKEGEEKDFLLREGIFHSDLKWKELFKTVECAGEEEVEGRPCYKLVMTPEKGKPQTGYYDKETHLLAKMDLVVVTAMGTIPVSVMISDYKEVDGLKIAHRVQQSVMGQTQLIVTETVEHNVQIPEGTFAFPDEIKELLKEDEDAAG